jgi:hypothetical protein
MNDLTNARSWVELWHEDGFATMVVILALVIGGLLAMLYSDRIDGWRKERSERAKWMQWNRS